MVVLHQALVGAYRKPAETSPESQPDTSAQVRDNSENIEQLTTPERDNLDRVRNGEDVITKGRSGRDVAQWQGNLNSVLGVDNDLRTAANRLRQLDQNNRLIEDGNFRDKTETVTRLAQKRYGAKTTGKVDRDTLSKIENRIDVGRELSPPAQPTYVHNRQAQSYNPSGHTHTTKANQTATKPANPTAKPGSNLRAAPGVDRQPPTTRESTEVNQTLTRPEKPIPSEQLNKNTENDLSISGIANELRESGSVYQGSKKGLISSLGDKVGGFVSGFMSPITGFIDLAKENPLMVLGVTAAAIGAAALFPVVATAGAALGVVAAIGFAGYGIYKASTADNTADRWEGAGMAASAAIGGIVALGTRLARTFKLGRLAKAGKVPAPKGGTQATTNNPNVAQQAVPPTTPTAASAANTNNAANVAPTVNPGWFQGTRQKVANGRQRVSNVASAVRHPIQTIRNKRAQAAIEAKAAEKAAKKAAKEAKKAKKKSGPGGGGGDPSTSSGAATAGAKAASAAKGGRKKNDHSQGRREDSEFNRKREKDPTLDTAPKGKKKKKKKKGSDEGSGGFYDSKKGKGNKKKAGTFRDEAPKMPKRKPTISGSKKKDGADAGPAASPKIELPMGNPAARQGAIDFSKAKPGAFDDNFQSMAKSVRSGADDIREATTKPAKQPKGVTVEWITDAAKVRKGIEKALGAKPGTPKKDLQKTLRRRYLAIHPDKQPQNIDAGTKSVFDNLASDLSTIRSALRKSADDVVTTKPTPKPSGSGIPGTGLVEI